MNRIAIIIPDFYNVGVNILNVWLKSPSVIEENIVEVPCDEHGMNRFLVIPHSVKEIMDTIRFIEKKLVANDIKYKSITVEKYDKVFK